MSSDKALIRHQKEVAAKVMDLAYLIDPFGVIAGGAARNWWFEKPAKDVDIYVRSRFFSKDKRFDPKITEYRLSQLFKTEVKHKTGLTHQKTDDDYDRLENELLGVFEFNVHGVEFDIMFMKEGLDIKNVDTRTFDCNLCMIQWNPCFMFYPEDHLNEKGKPITALDEYTASAAFLNGVERRVLKFLPDVQKNDKHVLRMQSYFPNFSVSYDLDVYSERNFRSTTKDREEEIPF